MFLEYTPEQRTLRKELRAYFAGLLTDELRAQLGDAGEGSPVFDHPYLHVVATPADHLLAMKVLAARGIRDGDDIRILLDRMKITTAAGVSATVARFFPDVAIPDRSRLLVEDILGRRD